MDTQNLNSLASILSSWARPMICLALASSTIATNAFAGGFLLAPTRLIFEGGVRAQELTIMNQSDTAQTYRMRLEDRRLRSSGEFDVITDASDPTIASPMLRLSARQIVIPARTSATLRVLLRKPAGLAAGEYRSHLVVTELPTVAPPAIDPDPNAPISVSITTVLGISIPVLVRSGETSARLSVPTVKRVGVPQQPDLDAINVRLETVGNRSMFVDLRVISTRQRRGEPIFLSKAAPIYTPVNARDITLSLTAEQTAKVRGGNVVLQYQEVTKDGQPVGPVNEVPF
jgi:fimbrial chaperone protein